MLYWPHPVRPMTIDEVKQATSDPDWQKFRRSIKGLETRTKLDLLYKRLDQHILFDNSTQFRVHEIQIDNYINALRRGGQLDHNNRVQK